MRTRAIYGCAGTTLLPDEVAFFRDVQPWGFILFGRNIADRDQVRALTASLRDTLGDASAPVLIDQEGGRVMRLKPPTWPQRPPQACFGSLYDRSPDDAKEAAYLNARLIAHDLVEVGINVDCMPVLDLPVEGADNVIGDRAFARDAGVIIELGRAVIEGLIEGSVLPVMKHVPGHGRATADTHFALPNVATPAEELSTTDFVPFRGLNHCPMAMTAHVVYDALDAKRPATLSPKVIRDVIRAEIGFEGLLLSDDISMGALSGSLSARTRAALFAGCDIVLHCSGKMDEMKGVAAEAKPLEGLPLRRAEHALSHLSTPDAFDPTAAEGRLRALMAA
jgi:beta-N-acetylhexosaminidase